MLFHFAGPGKETMWLIAFFWCMIRYYVYDMSHSRKHLRIEMVHWVIKIWTTHSFSSSLVADNVLWIIATADHFFGRCTNCTMYVWIVCNHKFMHVLSRHGATHLLLKIGPLTVLLGFFCDASVDSKNSAASNQTGIWSFHSFNLLEVFPMLLFSR